jgi:hypothetical protein
MIAWQPAGALAARHRFRDLAAPESGNAGRLAYLAQLLHRRLTLLTQMYRALNSPGGSGNLGPTWRWTQCDSDHPPFSLI